MTLIFLGLLAAGTVGCVLFVVLYHRWMDWTVTRFGRHLMAMTSMLGLLLGLTLFNSLFGGYPARAAVANVALGAMVVVIGRHLWILVDSRRTWRNRDR